MYSLCSSPTAGREAFSFCYTSALGVIFVPGQGDSGAECSPESQTDNSQTFKHHCVLKKAVFSRLVSM